MTTTEENPADTFAADWQPAPDATPAPPARETVALSDLQPPAPEDGQELIRSQFLRRGGSVLLVGPTGAGKSALAMQAGILWTLGKPCFGLVATQPLRVLYVQAENDSADLYEMREGIFAGLDLFGMDRNTAGKSFEIATVNDSCGFDFIANVFTPLLESKKPDLVILDPLLAYLGGDVSQQAVTGPFVRQGLQPAIAHAGAGLVLVHHPPKPKRDEGQTKSGEDAYYGAGSADLANWARAVIVLKATPQHGLYKLALAKRGRRAGWLQAGGATPAFERDIAHGDRGLIYWREADAADQTRANSADEAAGKLLALVPMRGTILQASWLEASAALGIGEKRARRILDTLADKRQVYLWKIPRPNCRAAVAIAREPAPETPQA